MTFKTKADKCFENQLKQITAPVGYLHDLGGDWAGLGDEFEIPVVQHNADNFDREACEKLFFRYGSYLELIDPDLQLTTSQVRTRMEAQ